MKILEFTGGILSSNKQFVRCGNSMCEERDATGATVKQFFNNGQTLGSSNYYYLGDHLGSVRSMTNSSGTVQVQYEYDIYGQATQTIASQSAEFGYAGMYFHQPSGLNLATYRAYNSSLGRWINRDPIGEDAGTNLYHYALNQPASIVDPSGLIPMSTGAVAETLGLPVNFPGGCFDLINGLTGNPLGIRPDKLPSTKCWYGPNAESQAEAEAKKCCAGGVVWAKNGTWTLGSPPLSAGPIDPNFVSAWQAPAGSLIDYVTKYKGSYYDLNGAGSNAGGNYYSSPPGGFPAQIWCSTCKNNK